VEIRLADYRQLNGESMFDKIASVGMMEHVGHNRLEQYFAALFRVLRPGGLLLNSAIADTMGENTLPWASQQSGGFIDRYIFPDGELLPLDQIVGAAEKAGYEVRDVESLREHYARTVSIWLSRLDRNFGRAVSLVGPRRARAYRLYLMSSAAAFRLGRIGIFHLLLAKRQSNGRACGLPLSRSAWYQPASSIPSSALPGS
jgi:cyclopropane-fatty-acyl-phospholipid synthase